MPSNFKITQLEKRIFIHKEGSVHRAIVAPTAQSSNWTVRLASLDDRRWAKAVGYFFSEERAIEAAKKAIDDEDIERF